MNHFKILDESTDDTLILEGYIAVFGGEDLTGEHFTSKTDFNSAYTRQDTVLIDWEHGQEPDDVKNQPGRDDILGKVDSVTMRADDIGLLARHVLDRREQYVSQFIEPLAQAELLGSSSEATPKGIKRNQGEIVAWPLKRQSFTVTPAETRLLSDHQMEIVKRYPNLKSLIGGGTAEKQDTDNQNGDNNLMSEKENQSLDEVTNEVTEIKAAIADLTKTVVDYVDAQKVLDETPAPKKAARVEVVEDETDKKVKADPAKLGTLLQATRSIAMGMQPTKAMKAVLGANEAIPSQGGHLVGTDQSTEFDKKMFETAVFSSRTAHATITNGANSIDFYGRKEDSRATGSRFGGIRGYRVQAGGTITASQPNFFKYTLKPSKYAILAYATDEIVNDSALLQSEILDTAPKELAFMLDDDIVNGSSAGYPEGILNANCLKSITKESGQAATTIEANNIIKMWAALWNKSNAVWFINTDVTPQLHQLNLPVGTGGGLVYMPPGGLSASPYGTLYGRPVIETEFNATLGTQGDILLADMSQYKTASVGSTQVATSIHVQFVTDQMAWRFTSRYDGQATWEAALTPYKGTNTVSPFVVLDTRS